MTKQYQMLKTILYFHSQALAAIDRGVDTAEIFKLPVREEITRAKYIPNDRIEKIAQIRKTIEQQTKELKIAENV